MLLHMRLHQLDYSVAVKFVTLLLDEIILSNLISIFKQFDSTSLQEMHLKLEEQIKRGLESKTFSDIEKVGIPGPSNDCHDHGTVCESEQRHVNL